jgi:polyisoprenoid-binding protein YceI
MGTVHAQLAITGGELRITRPVRDSHVEATVDAASFDSGNARRDRDVVSSRLLDVAQYPTITFSSTTVREDGDRLVVEGLITAHGTAVPTEVRVSALRADDEGVHVRARAEHLDRYAFGITAGRGMVGRYLDIELDVLAVPG